ncbi:MAG: Gfo/Idh/MocA family protein [Allomuricauda sp.]
MMTSRRDFIHKSALGAFGLPMVIHDFNLVKPSDKIRMGIIGMGFIGEAHLKWFASHTDVDIVAICDVDENRLKEKEKLLATLRPRQKVKLYKDFRHMLDRKDIDAISCATPDHWHALITIMAFESGKDVYGEKPLSHNIREGQAMLECMKKNNRIFQLGTQIHSGENYHRVVELIKSNILGKIHTVRLWKTGGSPNLGFPAPGTPPRHLDWDMWLGPAPFEAYTPVRCHGTYRHFLDYSGGVFGDFWCHIADVMYMALNPSGLKQITSRGERPLNGIADTPAWLDVDFKYDNLNVFWTTVPPVHDAKGMHIGAYFEGSEGFLLCDYDNRKIFIDNQELSDITDVPKTLERSPGHQRNFLDAVKSRKQPESNLAYAHKMTLPMHLALISYRLKRPVEWNEGTERFSNDSAANYLLSREYRNPWKLPKH